MTTLSCDRVAVYEKIATPGQTVRLPVPPHCIVSPQVTHNGAQWRLLAILPSVGAQAA